MRLVISAFVDISLGTCESHVIKLICNYTDASRVVGCVIDGQAVRAIGNHWKRGIVQTCGIDRFARTIVQTITPFEHVESIAKFGRAPWPIDIQT